MNYLKIILKNQPENKYKQEIQEFVVQNLPNLVEIHGTQEELTPCYNLIFILSRSLSEEQQEEFVEKLDTFLDEEFLVEGSIPRIESRYELRNSELDFNPASILDQVACFQHQRWIDMMSKRGYNYGLKVCHKNKTHPLMVPWEQLSEKYKERDPKLISKILEILHDQGFAVVRK